MASSDQRVVMITGAARGFGSTLVSAFAQAGYLVAATSRKIPEREARGDIAWWSLDVTNYDNCQSVVRTIAERYGRIDVIINNAAAYTAGSTLHDLPAAAISEELDVTLRGAIFVSKAYVDALRAQGHGTLMFISSTAGLSNEPECGTASVYAAAKAGLIRFAEALHDDIAVFGMHAQVVIPSNMRDLSDEAELAAEEAVSYVAAARALVAMADGTGNLRSTRVELRAARRADPAQGVLEKL